MGFGHPFERERFAAWLSARARDLAGFRPAGEGLRDYQLQDQTIGALTDAAARGDPAALSLGIDFLTVDPPMFAGRGAKGKLARRLRSHASRIDRAQLPALFAHWCGLFACEVVPQEGERVARLLGALADAGLRELALAVPVVIPCVERCIGRIVPDLALQLWLRMPAAVRDGDPVSWRSHWTPDDRYQVGRAIAASVPVGRRCEWARGVLAAAARDRRIDASTRSLLATAGDFGADAHLARWSWQRGRLRPGPATWHLAMAHTVDWMLGWEQPAGPDLLRGFHLDRVQAASLGTWRLAPLLARACAGAEAHQVEGCWQALTRFAAGGSPLPAAAS